MRQFFTGTTAGRLGRIELGLIGRAIETRQGVALLERLALTERQLDNPPGQLTGQHRLIPRPKHPSRLVARRTGRSIALQQRIVGSRRLRLEPAR
ncbi:hypothetical protein D3C76_1434990 [compost metagenome]